MSKYYNVKTTIDDLAIANKITKTLLEKMLVSSVQRREVSSTWWWKHELEEATEYMFSKMKEKYGTLEELDEIAIQCKAGFKVTDDYKEYLEKEGTKNARR